MAGNGGSAAVEFCSQWVKLVRSHPVVAAALAAIPILWVTLQAVDVSLSLADRIRSDEAAVADDYASVSTEQRPCGTLEDGGSVNTGWGPARPTFTLTDPPGHVTLNSIIDSTSYGDERAFFDVRLAQATGAGSYCNSVRVQDGDVLVLRTYVENGAPDHLAGENMDGDGVARNVRLQLLVDDEVSSLRKVRATLSSSNADPSRVWDDVELAAEQPFRLDFVRGSGVMYSNAATAGVRLDDAVWQGDGAPIGSRAADGLLAPGYHEDVIVIVKVRVTHVG